MASLIIFFAISASFVAATRHSLPYVADVPITRYPKANISTTTSHGGYYNFLNIRCGEAPIGPLRFSRPVPPRTVNRTISTGQEARTCYQAHPLWLNTAWQRIQGVPLDEIKPSSFDINNPPSHDASQSEDCLFLDVMATTKIFDKNSNTEPCDEGSGAPVLVWIDGGGFTGGYKHETNPAGLIKNSIILGEEFVYVSINYRLGLYGFLGGPTLRSNGDANAGLLDQRLALEWVQEYIHLFGGDQNRVTVMGESAGGGSILHQITAFGGMRGPPPFQQAILQSPGFQPNPGSIQQEKILYYVLNDASIFSNRSITTIDDLRSLDARTLAKVNDFIVANSYYGLYTFGPTVDGHFVPALPGQILADKKFHTSLALMIGRNDQEGVLFTSPYISTKEEYIYNVKWFFPDAPSNTIDHIVSLYPDQLDGSYGYTNEMLRAAVTSAESCFTCNTRYLNAKVRNNSYVYSFNVPPALHAEDVGYTFYNGPGSLTWDGKPVFGGAALSLQDYIVNFVATGTPNGRRVPEFPLYGDESNVLSINSSFLGTVSIDPVGINGNTFQVYDGRKPDGCSVLILYKTY
ncbi:carboxylesterase family protein [Sclerotinia borealis F-4128]|uniref:Carboxylic ester hydrolase n=1 Tax=Sclerotinia borealis (strain F-4128) TaxID=1432307 RepID=W9C0V9_SCLBF|nr:carboxylesterase family protein [Sclerotinia borealis F-4128]